MQGKIDEAQKNEFETLNKSLEANFPANSQ